MPKKPNPATVFQEEIQRSIPAKAGPREPWAWHPPDTPQFQLRCRKCYRGILKRRCTACQAEAGFDPRFTAKNPFDLLVAIPCQGTGAMRASVVPQILFALELKRTAGKIPKRGPQELHGLLGFKDVKPHQVSELKKVAAAGGVAGVLWLVELNDIPSGQTAESWAREAGSEALREATQTACHFIPISAWESYKAEAKGASMPLAAARVHGIEVQRDVGRGSVRRYWMLPELFIHFGADVEPTPTRKRKAGTRRKPTVKLFKDLPAVAEKLPFAGPADTCPIPPGAVIPTTEPGVSVEVTGLASPPADHPFMAKGDSAEDWPEDAGFAKRKPGLARKLEDLGKPATGLRERLAARRKRR